MDAAKGLNMIHLNLGQERVEGLIITGERTAVGINPRHAVHRVHRDVFRDLDLRLLHDAVSDLLTKRRLELPKLARRQKTALCAHKRQHLGLRRKTLKFPTGHRATSVRERPCWVG